MWNSIGGLPIGLRILLAILVVAALHLVYFVLLPVLLTWKATRSPRLRRYLEWVVDTPSFMGDLIKVDARLALMRLAIMEGRHEQVVEQGFTALRHRFSPTIEAETHWRLADALEALQRDDEAEEHRRLAEVRLKAAPQDASWYLARGRQFDTRRDFASASRMYELGLDVTPEGPGEMRALLSSHLSTALFHGGRMEEAAERARQAAELSFIPDRQRQAHRLAGAAYAEAGRLDESEAQKQRAAEIAEKLGDPKVLADSLADLAEMQRKRGRLAEALAACDQAEAALGPVRHIESVRYEIFRSWGRFDEALDALQRSTELDPLAIPRYEQKIQALKQFGRASVLLLHGRIDEAVPLNASARALLQGDEKVVLWCDAQALRIAALQGWPEANSDALERIERRLRAYGQDLNTRAGVLGSLGRAALALRDYERALGYWQEYRDLPPKPVDLPTADYHLGECHAGLGNLEQARACYRDAAEANPDIYYARLAQSRLQAILG